MINSQHESLQAIESGLLLEELFAYAVKEDVSSHQHALISDAVYARFLQCYGQDQRTSCSVPGEAVE